MLIKKSGELVVVSIMLLCGACASKKASLSMDATSAIVYSADSSVDDQVAQGLNAHRLGKGLPKLTRNAGLDSLARSHAQKMLGEGKLEHSNLDYVGHISESKYRISHLSENIMRAFLVEDSQVAEIVARSWIESKGHRFNVESKSTHFGVGIAKGADGVVYASSLYGTYVSKGSEEADALMGSDGFGMGW